MATENLKNKTITSMIWSAIQHFGVIFLSFIANLILARYLTPDEYGVIQMLAIFIALGETFVDSGLGAALVQKANPNEIDYSTVFWANLGMSIILYVTLFFFAPLISNFYNMPILTPVLRVKAICLIIQGFRIIQTTRLQKVLNFKKISLVYLIASLISTTASIICAIKGLGVWSLVIKTLMDTFIRTCIFWAIGKWKPLLKFSIKSFKELFSYGGIMLSTSIIMTIYSNVQSLIIGKAFSATDLGYYSQAQKLENLPVQAFESVVNQVSFPVFSKLKDDIEMMKKGLKKIVISITYIIFPLMIYFFICAKPIFNFLYTDKWDKSIPSFKYLCLMGMIYIVNTVNTNLIKATGKKRIYFNLQIIKRAIGLILLLVSVIFGMQGILICLIIIEYLFFIINAFVTKKTINYKVSEQIFDLLPNYILSIITGIIVFFIFKNTHFSNYITIILQLFTYLFIYIFSSFIFKFKGFIIYKKILLDKFHKE